MQLEIRRLHRELGVTMVFVTHDQSEAMTLSDRVAVFNNGRVEQLASPQVLYDAPANPFVANFLGDNNMISAPIESSAQSDCWLLRTGAGELLRGRQGPKPAAHAHGARATLCVRPESLQVAASSQALHADNRLAATLVDAIHQGDHWRLVVQLKGAAVQEGGTAPQWFAKVAPAALPPGLTPGQALVLGFRAEDAWVF
jgi:putative spermidine/putrescine transport system ATP-binding protein